ncbi:hypothetical protein C1646_755803 [Rhizophagus diaphanus]|nr:hypothetical protein C1646_755803 [Rhizophagus diaphanus] [Rhizophagus sp. MUCL 43196]
MCEMGIGKLEENIPTIVMFGDQSSGNSSILQRLTGGLPLLIPRGTKSIIEVRTLQTEELVRKISLRYIEDENHQPVSPREVEFIITEFDEEEIEEKLCEAQRYIKNPSITNVQNTRLPPDSGVVRNDESYENFALSLIKEYTKKETIILMPVFQATSGIDTQCVYRLAREADPVHDDEKYLELATLVKGQGQGEHGTYVIRNPTNSENYLDPDELEKETIRALKQLRIWRDITT